MAARRTSPSNVKPIDTDDPADVSVTDLPKAVPLNRVCVIRRRTRAADFTLQAGVVDDVSWRASRSGLLVQPPFGKWAVHQRDGAAQVAVGDSRAFGQGSGIHAQRVTIREEKVRLRLSPAVAGADQVGVVTVAAQSIVDHRHFRRFFDLRRLVERPAEDSSTGAVVRDAAHRERFLPGLADHLSVGRNDEVSGVPHPAASQD